MLISHKKYHTACPSPLLLNVTPLRRVTLFKYLRELLSSDLSWSQHIGTICCKARKLLGLIYRRYFQHADTPTLLHLYMFIHTWKRQPLSGVHIIYKMYIHALESVQKFALSCVLRGGIRITVSYYLPSNYLL